MRYDVYISYSPTDDLIAKRICKSLEKNGINCCIIKKEPHCIATLSDEIINMINDSHVFLYLASCNSYKSNDISRKEVDYAFNTKSKDTILPYIIDNSKLPLSLKLVFCGVNWRSLNEHSIDKYLIPDILRMLGRNAEIKNDNKYVSNSNFDKQIGLLRLKQAKNASVESKFWAKMKIQDELRSGLMEINGLVFRMKYVEGGGCDFDGKSYVVKNFMMQETVVTQSLWYVIMGTNPSFDIGNDKPVTNINWHDARLFVDKLNQFTKHKFRIPSLQEWLYAANGGNKSQGNKYSGGNYLPDVGWFKGNSRNCLHEVAELNPNELGIYDMNGNVWELCKDISKSVKGARLSCGGGFDSLESFCRINSVKPIEMKSREPNVGLRLVI